MRFHPVPRSSGLGRHARQQAAGDKGWKEIEVPSGPLWSSPHSLPRPHSLKRQVLPEGAGPTASPQRCRPSRAELVVPVTYHCVTNYPKLISHDFTGQGFRPGRGGQVICSTWRQRAHPGDRLDGSTPTPVLGCAPRKGYRTSPGPSPPTGGLPPSSRNSRLVFGAARGSGAGQDLRVPSELASDTLECHV